ITTRQSASGAGCASPTDNLHPGHVATGLRPTATLQYAHVLHQGEVQGASQPDNLPPGQVATGLRPVVTSSY
ncbi:MAG TPA: hypothetical protein PLM05_00965, partial [Bacteroidales bacterium]|nr:hypothetical protein [Bacteroidales bacterium]